MKLWHDDVRKAPDATWTWCRTNATAKMILSGKIHNPDLAVSVISMDHDLGGHDLDPDAPDTWTYKGPSDHETGLDLVDWMIRYDLVPDCVEIHSWNPIGARRMASTIESAQRYDFLSNCPTVIIRPYATP